MDWFYDNGLRHERVNGEIHIENSVAFGMSLKWSKKKTQNHYCTACRIPSACHHWLVLTTDKTATTNKRYQRYTQSTIRKTY